MYYKQATTDNILSVGTNNTETTALSRPLLRQTITSVTFWIALVHGPSNIRSDYYK
jgi:hypothetical protein